jgi:hypothetical protein
VSSVLSEAQFKALVQMFEAFAPRECERWSYLLGLAPRKWEKITPVKIWPAPSVYQSSPDVPFWELLSHRALSPHLDREALVLRCGHSSNPGAAVVPLREVLASDGRRGNPVIFEGFVSVVHGKLALGFNHEGGVCVFGGA